MDLPAFASKYFGLILLSTLVVAFALPNAFDLLLPFISIYLMVIMFFVFLKIDMRKVVSKVRKPLHLIYFLLLLMFIIPLIVFVAVQGLEPDFAFGFFLLAAMIPGSSILAMIDLFNGDLDLGLVLQVLYYIIVPFSLPLFLLVTFGKSVDIDVFALFLSLATLIFVPLVLSQLFLLLKKDLALKAAGWSSVTTVFFLSLLSLSVVANKATYILQNLQALAWLAVGGLLLFVFLQLSAYYGAFFLPKKERRTISIFRTFMNGTFALVIANQFFSEKVIMVIVITGFVIWMGYSFIAKRLFRLIGAMPSPRS